jgi:hypothetical protein
LADLLQALGIDPDDMGAGGFYLAGAELLIDIEQPLAQARAAAELKQQRRDQGRQQTREAHRAETALIGERERRSRFAHLVIPPRTLLGEE